MSNAKEYRVTSMEFKGEDSVGHYNYLLSFNKSLVHTGNLSKIEDGLNNKTNKTLQELKAKVESKYQNDELIDVCRGYDIALDDVVHLIEKRIDEAINE